MLIELSEIEAESILMVLHAVDKDKYEYLRKQTTLKTLNLDELKPFRLDFFNKLFNGIYE